MAVSKSRRVPSLPQTANVPPSRSTADDIEKRLTRNHPNHVVSGLQLHTLCDGDLVIVFTPTRISLEDKVELMRDVRDACMDTTKRVGIVVMPEGCTVNIAADGSPAAAGSQGSWAPRHGGRTG